MSKLIPFFDLNGKRYEIKPTRYLMLEYEKIGENSPLSDSEKLNAIKFQELTNDVRELAERLSEAKELHFADIANKELTAQYKAFKAEYKEAFEELTEFEINSGNSLKLQKTMLDTLEQLVIKGLEEQYSGIDGKEIWCGYVDSVGKNIASEWLVAMADCLFNSEEEVQENSFLAQVRARQKKSSRKKK